MEISKTALEDICYNADIEEENVRYLYSGRGMYGKSCLGIVGNLHDFAQFMAFAAKVDIDLAVDLANRVSVDNMGLGMIYYFPGVTLVDEEN